MKRIETAEEATVASKELLKITFKETFYFVLKYGLLVMMPIYTFIGFLYMFSGLMPVHGTLIVIFATSIFWINRKYIFPIHNELKQDKKELEELVEDFRERHNL